VQFIMMKLNKNETVIMNNYGKRYLYSGKVEKKDPLWVYESKHLIESLKKYDKGPNAPDIMAISLYDKKTEEVAAFEELVGSHGGIGGPQSFPFILYPNKFEGPKEDIVGAENVYTVLKGWLKMYSVKG
ncbi:phage holin family protein, partial [Candidatus Dojkabacteria bacterium]|nr:phage holin family protein [Candidatus Dojkabacteria bacterium]